MRMYAQPQRLIWNRLVSIYRIDQCGPGCCSGLWLIHDQRSSAQKRYLPPLRRTSEWRLIQIMQAVIDLSSCCMLSLDCYTPVTPQRNWFDQLPITISSWSSVHLVTMTPNAQLQLAFSPILDIFQHFEPITKCGLFVCLVFLLCGFSLS